MYSRETQPGGRLPCLWGRGDDNLYRILKVEDIDISQLAKFTYNFNQ